MRRVRQRRRLPQPAARPRAAVRRRRLEAQHPRRAAARAVRHRAQGRGQGHRVGGLSVVSEQPAVDDVALLIRTLALFLSLSLFLAARARACRSCALGRCREAARLAKADLPPRSSLSRSSAFVGSVFTDAGTLLSSLCAAELLLTRLSWSAVQHCTKEQGGRRRRRRRTRDALSQWLSTLFLAPLLLDRPIETRTRRWDRCARTLQGVLARLCAQLLPKRTGCRF